MSATVSALTLRSLLAPLCAGEGIDLCGVVRLPRRLPHTADWLNWLLENRHGDLEYLLRDPHARADPTRIHTWAETLLVFGQRYANGWTVDDVAAGIGCTKGGSWLDGVARYARGEDYHDVLRGGIRRITTALRDELVARGLVDQGEEFKTADAVDAGPYLEREYAWLAGLGFYGKNTMLIHPKLGSGLFLGVALLELEVVGLADAPRPLVGPPAQKYPEGDGLASLCGKCTRCQDACPTGALNDAFRLDAHDCLSTWSIEWRGKAPANRRRSQGGLLFGCDICQAVCPWNHKAARQLMTEPRTEYADLEAHGEIDLADLLDMTTEGFRARFRHTPLWRAHPEGLRRNALIVMANTGRVDLLDGVEKVAQSDPDPEVRQVAVWARGVLGGEKRP